MATAKDKKDLWNTFYGILLIQNIVDSVEITREMVKTAVSDVGAAVNPLMAAINDGRADATLADAIEAAVNAVVGIFAAVKNDAGDAGDDAIVALIADAHDLLIAANQLVNPPNQVVTTTTVTAPLENAGDADLQKAKDAVGNANTVIKTTDVNDSKPLAGPENAGGPAGAAAAAIKKKNNSEPSRWAKLQQHFGFAGDTNPTSDINKNTGISDDSTNNAVNADTLYITSTGTTYSIVDASTKDAYIMSAEKDNCWKYKGQVKGGGSITKNRRSRIAKTRNHKSKNGMTKKHINRKKRGTRVKSMR
jgi:hypothetical protein